MGDSILSRVMKVGWSGAYTWQVIVVLVLGAVAMLIGAVRLWRTWTGWPAEPERVVFRRRWAPFFAAVLVYLIAFLLIGPAPEGDQPSYELEAVVISTYQTRDMARGYFNPSLTPLMYSQGVTGIEAYRYKPGGELMSAHNVGLPLLLAPAVPLVWESATLSWGRRLFPWNIEMILLAALAAQVLYRILIQVRPRRPLIVGAVWAAVVFSPPMTIYANEVYPELPGCLLALLAVSGFLGPPSRRKLFGAAFAASLMPWLHVRFLPISIALVLGLAGRELLRVPAAERFRPAALRGAAVALAPFVVSMVGMGIAFQIWYGSFLPNAQYRVAALNQPVTLSESWRALAGGLWGSQEGWLPFAPVCILALACIGYSVRRYRWWALFGLAVAGVYLLTLTIDGADIGFSFPGRYMLVLVPFSALPLVIAAADFERVRWLFWPLAALTLYLTVAVVLEPPTSVSGVPGFDGVYYPQLLWPPIVDIWPQVIPSPPAHLYPNAAAVFEWSGGLLAACVAFFFARPRTRPLWMRRLAPGPR